MHATLRNSMKRLSSSNNSNSNSNSIKSNIIDDKNVSMEPADLENQNLLSPLHEISIPTTLPDAHASKVSFKERDIVQRHSSILGDERRYSYGCNVEREHDQVLQCSSNASFHHTTKSGLLRMKTRSRLMDPPMTEERRSSRMEYHSGMLGKTGADVEEEDPFDDELPDEYKKGNKASIFNVFQWVCLILIVAALVCSLTVEKLKGKVVWGLRLWKWEIMGLVLICGGLVSGWLIKIVVFFIERNFLLRKRVLYFVYGLRRSVQRILWLAWIESAWILILVKNVEEETGGPFILGYVTRVLMCFTVAALLWLVKTLLLKVLAMNFHVSAFFDRIQNALFNQYVIKMLSGPPCLELKENHQGEDRAVQSGKSLKKSPSINRAKGENECISIDHLHRMTQKNVSAWNMKRLIRIVRKGVLSSIDEHLDPKLDDDKALHIHSEKEAKIAAKQIFNNVAKPGARYIFLEDLLCFLREDTASITMHQFELVGEDKGISKQALKNWVVNVFRERRALALSLNDTKTAIQKLHQLVNIIVGTIVIFLWLLLLGVPIYHFLVFAGSQLVVLAFMFNNTLKTTFEAIIFLFVMHPFDVGDRCEIDGVQMVVEEMNILTTVFLKFDNQKVIYPNSVLAAKPINNYYRSPDMGDAIDFCIHISTPLEKISLMKERILRHIENNKEHWYTANPGPMIVMRDVEDMNRIKFSIWLSHTMNYQNMGERWARRGLLVEGMLKIFRDLDIEYRMLPMDVNVRNMPGLVSDRLPSNWSGCTR